MIDTELVQLYKNHKAEELGDDELMTGLIQALEGDEVQRERALAIAYEIRDRSEVLDGA